MDGAALQMAFSKKHVEDRKTWLSAFVPGTFLDSEAARITYSDFVHKVPTLISEEFSEAGGLPPSICCGMHTVCTPAAPVATVAWLIAGRLHVCMPSWT